MRTGNIGMPCGYAILDSNIQRLIGDQTEVNTYELMEKIHLTHLSIKLVGGWFRRNGWVSVKKNTWRRP